jgi:DNA-directed RNA polymerase specialized sigma24 family protein
VASYYDRARMDEHAWLAERFEEHRTRLRAVAYRMVGSLAEADEAVQDAWLRVSRLGAGEIDNLSGQNPACLSAESQV